MVSWCIDSADLEKPEHDFFSFRRGYIYTWSCLSIYGRKTVGVSSETEDLFRNALGDLQQRHLCRRGGSGQC